uniref:flagellar basal body rod protein FlgB n=1 Tax=Polynucleobacter sp. TaxID=2029855 RepID=UPI004047BA75
MNKLDALLDFNATALRVRSMRQEILAANIANADTPNYKARDIDFASVLKKTLENKAAAGSAAPGANATVDLAVSNQKHIKEASPNGVVDLALDHQKHIPGKSGAGGINEADLLYRPLVQGTVDGNSVNGEVERTAFVENALQYEANIMMLNASIKAMNAALSPTS